MVKEWEQLSECLKSQHNVTLESALPRIKRAAIILTCWNCEASFSLSSTMNGRVGLTTMSKRQLKLILGEVPGRA